ncbi:hypothetical protein HY633_03950 [Candidatus Uhrbacteria bacterium]|nr:hypothetical protein [Candidatus Uhrbacteria bacterium]
MAPQGKFIVVDGPDGAGKETQVRLVVERIRGLGLPVEKIRFPQYEEKSAGPAIRYVKEGAYGKVNEVPAKAAALLYAVDRYDGSFKIRRWLAEGKIVVSDRYIPSNMAHQGCKIIDAAERREFFRWLEEVEYGIFNCPRADLNVVLHVPAEVGQRRANLRDGQSDVHQSDISHLSAAAAVYLELPSVYADMVLVRGVEPDGRELLPEEIHERVWSLIAPVLDLAKLPAAP